MRTLETYDRVYHRRLAVSALVVLLLHAGLAFLPQRRMTPPTVAGPTSPRPGGTSIVEIEWHAGAATAPEPRELQTPQPRLRVTPPPPVIQIELEPPPEPVPESSPETASALEPNPSPSVDPGPRAGADPTTGSTLGTGGGPPVFKVLNMRLFAHPHVPEQIVAERKIDDFVLLRVLVGPDGRVRRVRVLRSIPNCEECNQSAQDAAWKTRYDPPLVDGRPAEVWTDIEFFYGRRAPESP